jgi:hypothetical protein
MLLRLIIMTSGYAASADSSSYRIKFARNEFLELKSIARPRIIYRRKKMYFFAFDGFVMYSDQCHEHDFSEKIIDEIEFSNYQWTK